MGVDGQDVVAHAGEEFHAGVRRSQLDDERSFSKQVLDHERADFTVAGQREFAQLARGEQLRERLSFARRAFLRTSIPEVFYLHGAQRKCRARADSDRLPGDLPRNWLGNRP